MSENMDTLDALLEDQLKDIYSAENQLLKALPKMAKRAATDTLREAFESHLEETRGQVQRLDRMADILGIKLTGKKCKAMESLIEEGKEVLSASGEEQIVDLALIGAAQRIEHYEISAYGTARTIAQQLGQSDLAELLQESLDEESAADDKLTHISEDEILPNVEVAGESEEEEEVELSEESDEEEEYEEPAEEEEEEEPAYPRRSGRRGEESRGHRMSSGESMGEEEKEESSSDEEPMDEYDEEDEEFEDIEGEKFLTEEDEEAAREVVSKSKSKERSKKR